LAALAQAAARTPLDDALKQRLRREWWAGSQWSSLSAAVHSGGRLVDLLAPNHDLRGCADAASAGVRAYVPMHAPVTAHVSNELAPAGTLHRFHLLAVLDAATRLGRVALSLDDTKAELPIVFTSEKVSFALSAGDHVIDGHFAAGTLYVPCALVGDVAGDPLVEHHYASLSLVGARLRASLLDPELDGFLGVEIRATPGTRDVRLALNTDAGSLGVLHIDAGSVDSSVAGRSDVAQPLQVVVPIAHGANTLEIERLDPGKPVFVRVMLRRATSSFPLPVAPRPPPSDITPEQLDRLAAATRALRAAASAPMLARARLHRAHILREVDALRAARRDLESALPDLDRQGRAEAQALLESLAELPLLPPFADGRRAVVLSPSSGLAAPREIRACVGHALAAPAEMRVAQTQACGGALSAYVAGVITDATGDVLHAARFYDSAFRQSRLPGLAREAALRLVEDASHGGGWAYALAQAAADGGDPEAVRALHRVRASGHWRAVHAVDAGFPIRLDLPEPHRRSLRAALVDLPWIEDYFEIRPGNTGEMAIHLGRPIDFRVEALCDGSTPEGCGLDVLLDGVPQPKTVLTDTVHQLTEIALGAGAHRIAFAHGNSGIDGRVFVRVTADRPLIGKPSGRGKQHFTVPLRPPPRHAFRATVSEPVALRVEAPTALQLDVISGKERANAIDVELHAPDGTVTHRPAATCSAANEMSEGSCHERTVVPLLDSGTYEVVVRPDRSSADIVLAIREGDGQPIASDPPVSPPPLSPPPSLSANPVELHLRAPMSNFLHLLGTLTVQQIGVLAPSNHNPRVGDHYAQTTIVYRRKLDNAPIWLKVAGLVRLRPGNGGDSFGAPTGGAELFGFARIPPINLRLFVDGFLYSQSVDNQQQVTLALNSYLERSFAVAPRFFLLPRFAFNGVYQSLAAPAPTVDNHFTPIDPQIWNSFDAHHPTAIYGQLLLWLVPSINSIVYGQVRASSNRNVHALDRVSARLGFDVLLHNTELTAYYDLMQEFVDDARTYSALRHRFNAEIDQNIWLHRNHRLVLRAGGYIDPFTNQPVVFFGGFWEASVSRGLDDYSTPEINLPQPLGAGRGIVRGEEAL
jgi:hypothetical protein